MAASSFSIVPMRIGEILDRGFEVLIRLLKPLAPYYLTLSAIYLLLDHNASIPAIQSGTWVLMIIPLWLLSTALYLYYYMLLILAGAPLWIGKKLDLRQARSNISIRLIFKVLGLLLRISFVAFLIPTLIFIVGTIVMAIIPPMGVAIYIATIFSVFPAMVYWLNRVIAVFVYIFEDVSANEALIRSKHLMSYHPTIPWYSFRTPKMRVSGIFLITFLVSLLPNAVAVGVVSQWGTGLETALTGSALILVGISKLLVVLSAGFSNLVLLGFYYDLRLRVEGLDIEQEINNIPDSAANIKV